MYDSDIVKAIFDSYLTGRYKQMRGWHDFELGGNVAPKDPGTVSKLKAIRSLIEMLPEGDAEWTNSSAHSDKLFKFIYKCRELELAEIAAKKNTRSGLFGFVVKKSTREEARLELAINAARTYVISRMNIQSARYSNVRSSDLEDELGLLRRKRTTLQDDFNLLKNERHLGAKILPTKEAELNETNMKFGALLQGKDSVSYEDFFNGFTKTHDNKRVDLNNKPLKEDTFKDFCENVHSAARTTSNLDKLMTMDPGLLEPSAKSNLPTPNGRLVNA